MKISDIILRGALSSQPAAGDVPVGALFFDTTNSILYRSNGTSWDSVSPSSTVADADYGDITVSGGVWTIDNSVVTEAKQSLSDNTTNDVSTSKHGYAPKAPNDATKYLDGTGAYSVPAGATEQKTPAFVEGGETTQVFERIQAGTNITITEIAGGEAISIAASGGGSAAWSLAASFTWSTNVTEVDFTGLSAYTDILLIVRNMTLGTSGRPSVRVSVDNGSNFLSSSGDYINIVNAGTESNAASMILTSADATAARTCLLSISAFDSTSPKYAQLINRSFSDGNAVIIPTSSALNAIRVFPSNGGNITGGTIYVFAR